MSRRTAEPADAAELPEWDAPPTTLEEFHRRIEAVGLSSVAGGLESLVRTSARLIPDPTLQMRVGATRLGGEPDLPASTDWPIGPNGPLAFIMQINLRDLETAVPGTGLPVDGLLSFFYDAVSQSSWGFDPADRGSWAVLYHRPDDGWIARPHPSALDSSGRFRALGLTPVRELSCPAAESYEVEVLGLTEPWEAYGRVTGDAEGTIHKLLGNPDPIHGDMQYQCQLASNGVYCGDGAHRGKPEAQALIPGSGAWRLLAQIDSSEEDTGMMWGDMGRLYFWLKEDDLRSQQWGNAWMILQCY